jgi:hypothetical protein
VSHAHKHGTSARPTPRQEGPSLNLDQLKAGARENDAKEIASDLDREIQQMKRDHRVGPEMLKDQISV